MTRIGYLGVLATAIMALASCGAIAFPNDNGPVPGANPGDGRALFLKNCAHCHGADARGNEGPDLHKLEVSDEWIANRIRKGKAGEMTAFAGKLQAAEIDALVTYLRTLK